MRTLPADQLIYGNALRQALRAARLDRGLSFRAVAEAAGIAEISIVKIEGGTTPNVLLHHLWAVGPVLHLDIRRLLDDPGRMSRRRDHTPPWSEVELFLRDAMRAARLALPPDRQSVKLAGRAIGQPHSTIIRMESGAYRRLDVIRLHALALHYGCRLSDWIP